MVPPPKQTERGAETRQRILDAATDLFLDRGYGQTPVSAIIDASGVTKGGFYFHFPSKAALGREVALRSCESQQALAMQLIDPEQSAFEQLISMPRAVAASTVEMPPMVMLGRLCMELRAEPDAEPVDPYAFWFAAVGELVRRAQADGDLTPGLDPDRMAFHLVTSYVGMDYVECIRGSDPPDLDIDSYLDFVLHGIGAARSDAVPPPSRNIDSRKGDD